MSDRRWQDVPADPTPPTVKVGQVWQSTDRREDRHVLVIGTDGNFATVARCDRYGEVHSGARRSRIRVVGDRLPRYRLIAPATPEEPDHA